MTGPLGLLLRRGPSCGLLPLHLLLCRFESLSLDANRFLALRLLPLRLLPLRLLLLRRLPLGLLSFSFESRALGAGRFLARGFPSLHLSLIVRFLWGFLRPLVGVNYPDRRASIILAGRGVAIG